MHYCSGMDQEVVKVASIFTVVMQSSFFCLLVPCRPSLIALQSGLVYPTPKANIRSCGDPLRSSPRHSPSGGIAADTFSSALLSG